MYVSNFIYTSFLALSLFISSYPDLYVDFVEGFVYFCDIAKLLVQINVFSFHLSSIIRKNEKRTHFVI